ncbi:MAG TPA: D-2-hydroxyacid dehydrogenase [Pirellulales bacterium]
MRLVLCYPVEERHLQRIRETAPDWEVVDAGQERVAQELLAADVYCGHAKVPVPWDEIVKRGRLRWIQSSAAGVDHCLTPEVIDSPIPVTSASGVLADQVAEQTFALLLGFLRGLPTYFRAQQKKEYVRRPTMDLHRTTVGIVGLGGNGRRLAEVLRPWKVNIVATDYFPIHKPSWVDSLWPADQLDELLKISDVVILTAPLNYQTKGMIDAKAIAKMRKGSVLINVARGPLVVESDLIAALKSGHLAGAGVDVAEVEPLPAESELWNLPNVVITPHVGGQCKTRIDDMTDFFIDNLRRYRAGRPLRNLIVDKRLGFPQPEPTSENPDAP